MEFDTQDALDAYLKDHPDADKSKHTVKSKGDKPTREDLKKKVKEDTKKTTETIGEHIKHVVLDDFHEAWEKSGEAFDKIVDKVDAATSGGRKFRKDLEGASEAVKTFIASPRYRRKKTQQLGDAIKSGAKKIAHQIAHQITHAIKTEVEEVKDGFKSFKQVLTKGSPPLTKKQKKAMYSTGAYVAGAAITAVGGGALAVATKVGSAFAIHVAIKAISHMADSFFTHFEWGTEASHVVHAVSHIASTRKTSKEGDAEHNEAIIEALVRSVAKVLSDGLSDKDIESMLAGEDDKAYDEGADIPALEKLKAKGERQKSSDKEAALRSRVIRLAHTRTDLRPHLIPLLVTTE